MSDSSQPFTLPDRSPLFKPPPRHYQGYRKLSVYCEADVTGLRAALPAGFEAASQVIEVFVMHCPAVHDLANPEMGPRAYNEAGVVAHVRYGELTGGHVLYELVTSDDAMAGGREIWGYPKKLAEVRFEELGDGRMEASAHRLGRCLVDVAFTPGECDLQKPALQPRIQVKRIPRADGGGFDVDQVIVNRLAAAEVHEHRLGSARIELGGAPNMDPLYELAPGRVLGAELVVADIHLEWGAIHEDRLAIRASQRQAR